MAGRNGVNCGIVRIGEDPTTATQCALRAFSERKPFRVRYNIQGIDSDVAGGLAMTRGGKLYGLSFDGNTDGLGGTSIFHEHVSQTECPKPYRMWVNPRGRLNCFQKGLAYPHNLMSPNFEPY